MLTMIPRRTDFAVEGLDSLGRFDSVTDIDTTSSNVLCFLLLSLSPKKFAKPFGILQQNLCGIMYVLILTQLINAYEYLYTIRTWPKILPFHLKCSQTNVVTAIGILMTFCVPTLERKSK
jgi:uncharacterized membrane protein YwaF